MSDLNDVSKSMIRFSWVMPLFGVQQFANLLRIRDPRQAVDDTTGALDAVAQAAAGQLSGLTQEFFHAGDTFQKQLLDTMFQVFPAGIPTPASPPAASPGSVAPRLDAAALERFTGFKCDPQHEEVIVRYTRGTGRFSSDKKYIALRMKMYNVDGVEDGYHEGVWEANFQSPQELLTRPAPPQGPMNEPRGPVEHLPLSAFTKAHWVFRDKSSITVVGPALSHLIPLPDESFVFMVSTAQIITGGTGRYANAYGLVQSLGATHVPKGVNLFGPQDVSFEATTFDTFRVVRGVQQGPPAGSAPPAPSPSSPMAPPKSSAPAPSANYSYEPHYADVHGSRMHYIDVGHGDPILFLHGNPTWSYLWRNVIPHLRPLGRCIAPDLIGMGRSDKPDIQYTFADQSQYLEGFITKMGLDNITLVIHDWGSILGFHYAMQHPDQIKGIAFMEALLKPYATWDDFPAPLRETFQQFRTPEVGWQLIGPHNVFLDQLLPLNVIRKLSDKEINYYHEPFRQVESRRPIWQFANQLPIGGQPADVAEAAAAYSRLLQGSAVPKLLLYAEPGAITTQPDIDWARQNLPNLEAVSIGPGIHFYQEDNPDGIGQALATWYQSLS